MSGNELDTFGGGPVGPYHNTDQPLAPSPAADTWGVTPDYEIADYQNGRQSGGQVQLFGEAMPPGATEQQINAALGQIAGTYLSDMSQLGHPQRHIQAAISWFQNNVRRTPQREQKQHNYNMYDQYADPVAMSFCNAMAAVGASQSLVSASLWWIEELTRRLDSQVGSSHDQPRTATTSSDPLDSLSDADYAAVLAHNQRVQSQTETVLRRKWGSSYTLNIQTTQEYLNNLPAVERNHFNQYTGNWVHALNTVEVLEFLFNSAIGRASIPTSGGAVASEITQIEEQIKYNRRAYNNDLRLQARLRTLYSIRDGR